MLSSSSSSASLVLTCATGWICPPGHCYPEFVTPESVACNSAAAWHCAGTRRSRAPELWALCSSCACAPGLRSGRRGGWVGTWPGGRGDSWLPETLVQDDCSKPPGSQRQRLPASSFTKGSCASFESAESVAGGSTHSWRLYGQDLRGGTGKCGSVVSLLQEWPLCDAIEGRKWDTAAGVAEPLRSCRRPVWHHCGSWRMPWRHSVIVLWEVGGTPLSLFSGCRGFRGRGGDDIPVPLFSEMRCHQGALHHPTAFLHPTRTLC